MKESKHTLREGEDAITFGVDRAMKHSRFDDDTIFSIDKFDELLEKELASWQECNTGGFTFLSEGNFYSENDLEELERLLKESEFEELKKHSEK